MLRLRIWARLPADWREWFARRPKPGEPVVVLPTIMFPGGTQQRGTIAGVSWGPAGLRRKQLYVEIKVDGKEGWPIERPLEEFSFREGLKTKGNSCSGTWLLQLL